MTILQKAADVAHKSVVLGLLSFFGFQVYQVGTKAYAGYKDKDKRVNPLKEFVDALRSKNIEQAKLSEKIDYREWYDPEDKSYIEQQAPMTNRPKPNEMK